MRATLTTAVIAAELLDGDPARWRWGYDIIGITGLQAGTVFPVLQRMHAAGWLIDRRESSDFAAAQGRPPRRYYKVSAKGRQEMPELVARHQYFQDR